MRLNMSNRYWIKSECASRGRKLKDMALELTIRPSYLSMYIQGYTPSDDRFAGLEEKIRGILARWDGKTATEQPIINSAINSLVVGMRPLPNQENAGKQEPA